MTRTWWILLLVAGCHAAAGGGGAAQPSDGSVVLRFAAGAVAPGPLSLSAATVRLEQLWLIGDVQSNAGSILYDVDLDATGVTTAVTFAHLSEGVYSRLRLSVEGVAAAGTWNGTPFTVALELEDAAADLRTPGEELAPGQTIVVPAGIRVGDWFAGVDFSHATVDDRVIRIDGAHNLALAQAIADAVPGSFFLAGM